MLATETQAKKQERYFKKGLQRRLELITNVLRLKNPGIGDYRDINIMFQRNFIIDNDAERDAMREDIAYALADRTEYRRKFYNETVEEAQKAITEIDQEKAEGVDDAENNPEGITAGEA
jgi:hypothetical protein